MFLSLLNLFKMNYFMLRIDQLSYQHPSKNTLFRNLDLSLAAHQKIALIGNNGSGKSTLLKLIAGDLEPFSGQITLTERPYYIPQLFGQFDELTIAEALNIAAKLNALKAILDGSTDAVHFDTLNDDWNIEERAIAALAYWELSDVTLDRELKTLSGGQKTKVFLAGVAVHQPELILMDEPSNHLDMVSRQLLYDLIKRSNATMVIVSHDKTLLNLLGTTIELHKDGLQVYGGNYDHYSEQRTIALQALQDDVQEEEKALRKAREKQRISMERQQKLDARGKQKQQKAGVAKIMMNTMRNNAEQSTARTRSVHSEKISNIRERLNELRADLPDLDKMRLNFDTSQLHKGKVLFKAEQINFIVRDRPLWRTDVSLQVNSGDRLVIKGRNGSGKTTLINTITGSAVPGKGAVTVNKFNYVHIDQEYSLINEKINVYEQLEVYNDGGMEESELKSKLTHFLFFRQDWHKSCAALSGGERMRLLLCCLSVGQRPPDIMILDEPTNNLDLQNIAILSHAVAAFDGTLLVVSHDEAFLTSNGMNTEILLG